MAARGVAAAAAGALVQTIFAPAATGAEANDATLDRVAARRRRVAGRGGGGRPAPRDPDACRRGPRPGRTCSVDLTLARGLGYYTGAIFEIAVADLAGSLGGGGRYDDLVGMFLGQRVPACGLSLGLERILVVMGERGMFPPSVERPPADVLVANFDAGAVAETLALAATLRAGADGTRPGRGALPRRRQAGQAVQVRVANAACRSWR